ncbi:MAG: hypothetical protein IPI42_08620 [Saprospiraceae bacterium]|nr:hypothetical protein [Candidatus Parvibacillus calidus]
MQSSNPPYIGFDELDKMDNHVLKSEPRIALFAGEDPWFFTGKLLLVQRFAKNKRLFVSLS